MRCFSIAAILPFSKEACSTPFIKVFSILVFCKLMLFSEALLAQGKIVDCTLNNLSFQHCACETDFSWQPQLLIRNYITAGAGKHNHLMTHTGVFGNDYYNSSSAVRLHDNCHDMHPSWQDWNYISKQKLFNQSVCW